MTKDERAAEAELSIDIKRAMILGRYIDCWGQPENRTLCSKDDGLPTVEVYGFPPKHDAVYRIATVGISNQARENGSWATWELLFCLPEDLGGANRSEVVNYLLDIMAYTLRDDVSVKEGTTIPETPLAPESWTTRSILFDEARGEPEELSHFHVGTQRVDVFWLVPLTEKERAYVREHGLDAFDEIEMKSDSSLIDVSRKSIV